ncbi:hypothetical protein [Amycolatopsis rifamycinica]|uniref:hypothetical protein n=1 Tax=Amycolatopsis rifamycinica TaxID=287986 RepID=UPI000A822C4B|nr:hypothetical protein [Amycolatopsis rifamycinica]
MAHNITHPVETFKEIVAWDDWANGHGDRALGKITGGLLLFGAGKVAKGLLSKGKHAGGDHVPDEGHPKAPADRAKAVQEAVSGKDGNIPGVEDSKGVRMVPAGPRRFGRQRPLEAGRTGPGDRHPQG